MFGLFTRPETYQPKQEGLSPEGKPAELVTPAVPPTTSEVPNATPEATVPAAPVFEAVSPTEAVATSAPVTELTPPAEPNDLHAEAARLAEEKQAQSQGA